MKRAWIAALLNFFFAGLGYVVLGERRLLGVGWTIAAVGLTYVELSVQTAAPALYWPMFASVFLLNTCFAVDAFQLGKRLAGASGSLQPAHA